MEIIFKVMAENPQSGFMLMMIFSGCLFIVSCFLSQENDNPR